MLPVAGGCRRLPRPPHPRCRLVGLAQRLPRQAQRGLLHQRHQQVGQGPVPRLAVRVDGVCG